MKTVSAADANRQFSSILRRVKGGEAVTVTSRGKPVARIEPVEQERAGGETEANDWQEFLAELNAQPALNLGRITRDEIYDD